MKEEHECVKIEILHTRKTWFEHCEEGGTCLCVHEGQNECVCASLVSGILPQILIPFHLREREELGKFYLFNGSAM